MIFEFKDKKSNQRDWIKAPNRKEAILFIMSENRLNFADINKIYNIRELTLHEQKTTIISGDNTECETTLFEYSETISNIGYIASTEFYY